METLNINLIKSNPLSIPTILAERLNIFEKYGVKVNLELQEDFTFKPNSDFLEGKTDAMMGDTTFYFYMLEQGKKAKITSNLTRTIFLVGRKGIKLGEDGIRVGVNRKGLFRLFAENDIKDMLPNYKITWINNTFDRMEALRNNEIDALVAIEPFVSQVLDVGGEIIWNSRNSDKNLVMWCFGTDVIKEKKEAIRNFYKALAEAEEIYNNATQEERVKLCVEVCEYKEEKAIKFKDFTFEKVSNYSHKDFELCQEWMFRNGEISKIYDSKECIEEF